MGWEHQGSLQEGPQPDPFFCTDSQPSKCLQYVAGDVFPVCGNESHLLCCCVLETQSESRGCYVLNILKRLIRKSSLVIEGVELKSLRWWQTVGCLPSCWTFCTIFLKDLSNQEICWIGMIYFFIYNTLYKLYNLLNEHYVLIQFMYLICSVHLSVCLSVYRIRCSVIVMLSCKCLLH